MYLYIYLSISLCLSLSSSRPRPSPGISYTAEHSKYLRSHSGDESSLIFRVGGQKKKKKSDSVYLHFQSSADWWAPSLCSALTD